MQGFQIQELANLCQPELNKIRLALQVRIKVVEWELEEQEWQQGDPMLLHKAQLRIINIDYNNYNKIFKIVKYWLNDSLLQKKKYL